MEWLTHELLQGIINLVIIIFTSVKSTQAVSAKIRNKRKSD